LELEFGASITCEIPPPFLQQPSQRNDAGVACSPHKATQAAEQGSPALWLLLLLLLHPRFQRRGKNDMLNPPASTIHHLYLSICPVRNPVLHHSDDLTYGTLLSYSISFFFSPPFLLPCFPPAPRRARFDRTSLCTSTCRGTMALSIDTLKVRLYLRHRSHSPRD
jgi:hypothetical protein